MDLSSTKHDPTAAWGELPGSHRPWWWEGPHQGSACGSHNPQSKGPCRLWAGGRPHQIGSPESLWCRCLVTSHTSTQRRRRCTAWPAAVPQVPGSSSTRIPVAEHCLCARKKKHINWIWVFIDICCLFWFGISLHQLHPRQRRSILFHQTHPPGTSAVHPLEGLHSSPAVTQVDWQLRVTEGSVTSAKDWVHLVWHQPPSLSPWRTRRHAVYTPVNRPISLTTRVSLSCDLHQWYQNVREDDTLHQKTLHQNKVEHLKNYIK